MIECQFGLQNYLGVVFALPGEICEEKKGKAQAPCFSSILTRWRNEIVLVVNHDETLLSFN